MKRLLISLILTLLVSGLSVAADQSPALEQALATAGSTEMIPAILLLDHRLTMDDVYPTARGLPMDNRRGYVVSRLKERFAEMSPDVMETLDAAQKAGHVKLLRPLWIVNGIRVRATADVLRNIDREHSEVVYMLHDAKYDNTLDDVIGWGVLDIEADRVWYELDANGSGVIVGHKDSGIDHDCPEFDGHIWINEGEDLNGDGTIDAGDENEIDDDGNGYVDDFYGWDFDDDDNDVTDTHSHGTRTASVISSGDHNGDTVAVAPGAKLMVLLGHQTQGAAFESSQYAIEMGANVISASMSFKWGDCDQYRDCPNHVFHRIISEMELAAGIIHANSTGNSGCDPGNPLSVPAPASSPPPAMTDDHPLQGRVSSIVSVQSYSSSGFLGSGAGGPFGWSREDLCVHPRAAFCGPPGSPSEFPPEYEDYPYQNGAFPGLFKPDVAAPTSVSAITIGCGVSSITGTSGATPHVGGVLALIYSAFPGITPEQTYLLLVDGAEDAGDPGPDHCWGFGKLRAFDACATGNSQMGAVRGVISVVGDPMPNVRVSTADRRPVYSDQSGNYALWLSPGEHVIAYDAWGVSDHTETVIVDAGQATVVDVSLSPEGAFVATLQVTEFDLGIPLGGIEIEIPEADLTFITDEQGMVVDAQLMSGIYEFVVGGNSEYYATETFTREVAVNVEFELERSSLTFPTGGPDSGDYWAYDDLDWHGPQYDWIEIDPAQGGCGEELSFTSDNCIARTLPFPFRFYGQDYTAIRISPNGFFTFSNNCPAEWGPYPIPSTDSPDAYVAVLWQDYVPEQAGRGDVYYCAEDNRVIIEWDDMEEYWRNGRATFQVILMPVMDDDGTILCQYADNQGRLETTIGVENADGTMGLEYARQLHYADGAAPVRAGRAIRFISEYLTEEAVMGTPSVPEEFVLEQNYPNPFNPSTTFAFSVPRVSKVRLALYDILGREAALVFEGIAQAGRNVHTFDAADLPTGIYFARLESADRIVGVRKVMLLK